MRKGQEGKRSASSGTRESHRRAGAQDVNSNEQRREQHVPTGRPDDAAEIVDAQLSLLAAMRDASVRSVALRAAGLSVESLAAVQVVIDHARRLEGLEPDTDPEGPEAGPAADTGHGGRRAADATGDAPAGQDASRPGRHRDG